jgi:hypothetical protein
VRVDALETRAAAIVSTPANVAAAAIVAAAAELAAALDGLGRRRATAAAHPAAALATPAFAAAAALIAASTALFAAAAAAAAMFVSGHGDADRSQRGSYEYGGHQQGDQASHFANHPKKGVLGRCLQCQLRLNCG